MTGPEGFRVTDRRTGRGSLPPLPPATAAALGAAEREATETLRETAGRDDVRAEYDLTPGDGFAQVVDHARVTRILSDARDPSRPLPSADELHAAVQYDRAVQQGDTRMLSHAVRMLDQALGGGRAEWSVPASAPAAAADAALVLYLAACAQCARQQQNLGEGEAQHMAVPFGRETDRDRWAATHAAIRGHRVALVEQHPHTGSTITGHVDPPARGAASAPIPDPPLIAFVVRSGREPEMLCTIPDRAGAAWLLTAAHACMLGAGSLGIPQPHRVLYVGRMGPVHPDTNMLSVRIDGLLGATGPQFAAPVGFDYRVSVKLDPASAENVLEAMICHEHGIGRNLFSVVLMTDAELADVADPVADAEMREQRLADRATFTERGGRPAAALSEFVDMGPAAEVADVPPRQG